MPLPPPVARKHLHHRRIDAEGFLRDDGLWDIDAHIVDTKGYGFSNAWRGEVEPGTPVHDMYLRVTVDDAFTVVAVVALTESSPFEICPAITPNFQRLVGLTIGKGWRQAIKARLGGVQGCTHLVDLLGPLGTVAFQTIAPYKSRKNKQAGEQDGPPQRPGILDTCHALASDGEVARQFFPAHYTGPGRV